MYHSPNSNVAHPSILQHDGSDHLGLCLLRGPPVHTPLAEHPIRIPLLSLWPHRRYAELAAKVGGTLAEMVASHTETEETGEGAEKAEDEDGADVPAGSDDQEEAKNHAHRRHLHSTFEKRSPAEKKGSGVLVKEEVRKKGKVGLDVYRRYLGKSLRRVATLLPAAIQNAAC